MMAYLIDFRAAMGAVPLFPDRGPPPRDCLACAGPPLVSAWTRDPSGRPVRRWRLQPHTHA
jgi:hypothetical protein